MYPLIASRVEVEVESKSLISQYYMENEDVLVGEIFYIHTIALCVNYIYPNFPLCFKIITKNRPNNYNLIIIIAY